MLVDYIPAMVGTPAIPPEIVDVRRDSDGRLVLVDADGRRYTVTAERNAFLRASQLVLRRVESKLEI
jgi:hypothetical protein